MTPTDLLVAERPGQGGLASLTLATAGRSALPHVSTAAMVVVGVGGPADAATVHAAGWEAQARRSPLLIVHASSSVSRDIPWLSTMERTVRHDFPLVPVDIHVTTGSPVQAVLADVHPGCLVVSGHRPHPRGPITRSVAFGLASASPAPVMVDPHTEARPNASQRDRVVVAVASLEQTDLLLESAMFEAAVRRVPLYALDLRPPGPSHRRSARLHHPRGWDADAELFLDEVLLRFSQSYADVSIYPLARHGIDPVIALAAASHSAAMVVVGRTNTAKPSLAATPYSFLNRAVCPVTVVPMGAR